MPIEMHTHNFNGVTTFDNGHTHKYSGVTDPAPDVPGHIHSMTGVTTVDDRHNHNYNLKTSKSMEGGLGHYHYYQAATLDVDGHHHNISGNTDIYLEPAIPVQRQVSITGQLRPNLPPGQFPPGRPGQGRPPGQFPPGRPGQSRPPGQFPPGRPGPPYMPPPTFVPVEPRVTPFALDRITVSPCLFKFSYIWPRRGQPFWAWIFFVDRRSFAGFRWSGRGWFYFAMDLTEIRSIQCY